MKITKIKINLKETFIAYVDSNGAKVDYVSEEEPNPNFKIAFDELRNYMSVLAELPDKAEDIIMKGVHFGFNKDDFETVGFSFMRVLTTGEQMLQNLRPKKEEDLSDDLIMALEEVRKQAIKFVGGERKVSQQLLFDKESGIGFPAEEVSTTEKTINKIFNKAKQSPDSFIQGED